MSHARRFSEFAAEFDPQPMHLDEEAAKHSMLKGLAGSGWHLCAIWMRMVWEGFISRIESMGAPGVKEVRWVSPLRPGDDLTLDVEVLGLRESKSRPDLGFVHLKNEIRNASGQVLMVVEVETMVLRRHAVEAV